MLRVTVEIWPGGDSLHPRTLEAMEIINDDTGDALKGNYDVELSHHDYVRIENFDRTKNVWELVRLILEKLER